MEKLISVIVPIYNSEEYLSECVESVLAQTYQNFELLLIDDGSKDNSRVYCGKMCEKDKRIRLIGQEHKGVSAARNMGLREARGEYLFFLDSDDTIHYRLLEELYLLQEKRHAAIATEGRCYSKEYVNRSGEHIYLNNDEAIRYFTWGKKEAALYGIGGKMIRRSLADATCFDERLAYGEDTIYMYQLLIKGNDVVVLGFDWYFYRRNGKGASSVFSVEACNERLAVERYVSEQEIKNGRMKNAAYWERSFMGSIMNWYAIARKKRDYGLIRAVKNIAKIERKMEIYSYVDKTIRVKFFLTFFCYPVHRFVFRIYLRIMRYRSILGREKK